MCQTSLNKVRLKSDFGAAADSYAVPGLNQTKIFTCVRGLGTGKTSRLAPKFKNGGQGKHAKVSPRKSNHSARNLAKINAVTNNSRVQRI